MEDIAGVGAASVLAHAGFGFAASIGVIIPGRGDHNLESHVFLPLSLRFSSDLGSGKMHPSYSAIFTLITTYIFQLRCQRCSGEDQPERCGLIADE